MQYRSTNTAGFVHFGGEVVAGAQDGNGVSVRSVSTGSHPVISAQGDDTACSLVLTGASSVAGSGVRVGVGSTTSINAVERYYIDFTPPALSTTAAGGSTSSTYTAVGLTTNAVLVFQPSANLNSAYNIYARCSTTSELRLFFQNISGSTIGTGESTQHGTLLAFKF